MNLEKSKYIPHAQNDSQDKNRKKMLIYFVIWSLPIIIAISLPFWVNFSRIYTIIWHIKNREDYRVAGCVINVPSNWYMVEEPSPDELHVITDECNNNPQRSLGVMIKRDSSVYDNAYLEKMTERQDIQEATICTLSYNDTSLLGFRFRQWGSQEFVLESFGIPGGVSVSTIYSTEEAKNLFYTFIRENISNVKPLCNPTD